MQNHNPTTGVAYGYIAANDLDPEVVDALMYGSQAKDLSYVEALEEHLKTSRAAFEWVFPKEEFDADFETEVFNQDYEVEEPHIEGVYEGVTYGTSWLGGALHFFILESPVISEGKPCSLCVPLALDLGSVGKGNYEGYGVPADWRAEK